MEDQVQRGNSQRDEARLIRDLKDNRLLSSGALAISITFTGLLPFSSERDMALTICLFSFAISIPITSLSVYVTSVGMEHKVNPYDDTIFTLVAAGGLLATYVGLVSLFWHFFCFAGLTFLTLSIAAIAYAIVRRKLYTRPRRP